MDIVYDDLNEETIAAKNEAESRKDLETLYLSKFKKYVASP